MTAVLPVYIIGAKKIQHTLKKLNVMFPIRQRNNELNLRIGTDRIGGNFNCRP